jgi:hypothetical protein
MFHFIPVTLLMLFAPACYKREAIDVYPPNSLHVRYEDVSSDQSCLVASVVMAANYVDPHAELRESAALQEIADAGMDETLVADVKKWIDSKGFKLIHLKGQFNNQPPFGMHYWVQNRGYPVVCIVEKEEDKPSEELSFHHAVVVIGVDVDANVDNVDRIHYIDPISIKRLEFDTADDFEASWARGGYGMLLVILPPKPESGQLVDAT